MNQGSSNQNSLRDSELRHFNDTPDRKIFQKLPTLGKFTYNTNEKQGSFHNDV